MFGGKKDGKKDGKLPVECCWVMSSLNVLTPEQNVSEPVGPCWKYVKIHFNRSPARAMQKSSSEAKMICCYPLSHHVPPKIGMDQYPGCCIGFWDGFQIVKWSMATAECGSAIIQMTLTGNRHFPFGSSPFSPSRFPLLGVYVPFPDTPTSYWVGYSWLYNIYSKRDHSIPKNPLCCWLINVVLSWGLWGWLNPY